MDTGLSTMGSVRKPGIVTVSPFLKKSSRFPPFAARTAASRSGTVMKLVFVTYRRAMAVALSLCVTW